MTTEPLAARYDRTERLADQLVHAVGILAAIAGVVWLISRLSPQASVPHTLSVWVYGFGLLCMLIASALYNAAPAGRLKARLRRLDHAMIFVMIAGTYTPFSLIAFPAFSGHLLFAIIWSLALAGVLLKFVFSPRSGFWSVSLYVGMAWVIVAFLPTLLASVTETSLLLLLFGGIVYSSGAFLHAWGGIRFHNVIWHVMVIVAAALHFGAVAALV